jgi:hypothetical protein
MLEGFALLTSCPSCRSHRILIFLLNSSKSFASTCESLFNQAKRQPKVGTFQPNIVGFASPHVLKEVNHV